MGRIDTLGLASNDRGHDAGIGYALFSHAVLLKFSSLLLIIFEFPKDQLYSSLDAEFSIQLDITA
jgi:hypothetical protein